MLALAVPAIIWFAYHWGEGAGVRALAAATAPRFEVYRALVTAELAPLATPPALAGADQDALLERSAPRGDIVLVLDDADQVRFGSDPALRGWRIHAARVPGDMTRAVLLETLAGAGETAQLVRLHRAAAGTDDAPRLIAMAGPVAGHPWRLMLLADARAVDDAARTAAWVGVLGAVVLLLAGLYVEARRDARRQAEVTEAALLQANDVLERKVTERTAAIAAANEHLRHEIAERERAQQAAVAAQAQLVQAGKLAVLGQMSAGITHELNQPLGALRTLSDNGVVFLQRGRVREAESNLVMIGQLVDRMGRLTTSLKTFARQSDAPADVIAVRRVIFDALFLVERRMRLEEVRLEHDIPDEEVLVRADATRLGQVLVNLFANALDAMADAAERVLRVSVEVAPKSPDAGDRLVRIRVRDTGCGIPPDVLPHLFEPFFTTKPPGAGLGLGLAISGRIVTDFGGRLDAGNAEGGGAEFVVTLVRPPVAA